jgi:hypothetical protein
LVRYGIFENQFATEKMSWDVVKTSGVPPSARGYHTANVADDGKILVLGGSDGKECFSDLFSFDPSSLEFS